MKSKIYLLFILSFFVFAITSGQNSKLNIQDTGFFNYAYWNGIANKTHLNTADRAELLTGQKKIYLDHLAHQHIDPKEIAWVSEPTTKGYGQNATNAGPCTNIDFESGTFSGWTRSTGFNPLANVVGCCASPNGDQTIMTGAGTDPFGGYPVVYPGGGSFSLRLGSTATGGIADRISQTFFVTTANSNFTYRYAVVLNDPTSGHTPAQKPKFTSEIIDSLGNSIICTTYSVTAGSGIPGFVTSSLTANGGAVVTKNWTNVAIDLSPNIGQNVTIQFTVYDCGPTGHFAYAYLDGLCTNFALSVSDTTCPNVPLPICAPAGFSTTTWNGPGVVNDPNQCILVTIPGTYTCTTILVPGCPGPTFTHTLSAFPNPVVSFTPVTAGVCATQYTFNSNMSIASGSIVSHGWDFGDGSSGVGNNPVHNYANAGTYPVKLRALSGKGCLDSVVNFITIFPTPNLIYSPPSNCINTLIQFTNTSNISVGTITGYTWTLGNGATSNLVNPTNTYTSNGTYTITLTAISNLGCPASLTQTLGIFPPPVISFTASPLCDINGTAFSPSTSTAIASGSLTQFFWEFGDGGTSIAANPVYTYTLAGPYTVSFTAISNHNCPAFTTNSFIISPSPTVAFSTYSLNACSTAFSFTNNSAISAGPISYTWNIAGNISNTNASVLTHTFPGIGNYLVTLIGSSNMGCADTATQFISIYPLPIINFSVPASCENAIFSVSTTAVSGSVTSYNWNFGDPGSGVDNLSDLQNPTHFYPSTGSFVIVLNLISNLNCPSSMTTPIVVFPNPVSIFSHTTLNNCSLPFTYLNSSSVSAIGASTIISNLWNINGVTSNTLNPATTSFPSNGSYSVSLIVTTNHNCSDTMSTNILVHPLPSLDFTVNPTCLNVPLVYASTASISPIPLVGSSITSYTWNLGDGNFFGTPTIAPHSYATNGIYNIIYSATSNMGCLTSVTKSVTIHPTPVISFSTTSNMCLGFPTQYTSAITIVPTSTIYAFNWDFGDGSIGSNSTTAHTYSTSGDFVVTYSATTNNECLSTLTKTVTIFPLPIVSFTANNACFNSPTQFVQSSTVIPGPGQVNGWNWNFGDGNFSTQQNPIYTYTAYALNYVPSLTVTSIQGCVKTATYNLTVNPLPNISFSPSGGCVGALIQFTNTSFIPPPTGTITSFVWDFSDGTPTVGVTAPSHSYAAAAVYVITLTATSDQNCVRTATNNLTIYPYPSASITPLSSSCINNTVVIQPNITIGGSGNPFSYTLSYGDGSPAYTATAPASTSPLLQHVYAGYNTFTLSLNAMANGCATATTSTIKVYPKPFTNFSSSNFCKNELTQFVNTSSVVSSNSMTNTYSIQAFLWEFDDGASTSTVTSPSYTFISTGVHNVSLTAVTVPEPGLTCSLTTVKAVTIHPLPPLVPFTTNSVCLGSVTQFSNGTSTAGITGWSWLNQNGQLFSVSTNPVFTYTSSGTFLASLVGLTNFGCKDTIRDSVRVYSLPTASFTTNNVCFGNDVLLLDKTLFTDGTASTYTWNTNGILAAPNQPNSAATYPAPGTYSVQIIAGSSFGCIGKYTNTVSVYPLPSINFTATEVCENNPTQFTNYSSISSGNIASFLWSFSLPAGTSTSSAANPTVSFPSSGSYATTLQATSNNNCPSVAKVLNVLVHGKPVANFTSNNICVGDKHSFVNLSTSTDGTISSSQWDFTGDNIIDQNQFTPVYTYSVSGNFNPKLTVTTQYGCLAQATIPVFANPKAVPNIVSDKRSGCPSLCIKFDNVSKIDTGSFTTTWDFGDGSPANTFTTATNCYSSGNFDLSLTMVSDKGCITRFVQPGYVTVFPLPSAGFKVEPEEIDEDEPIITVSDQSSSDVNSIKYYINDGASYSTPKFTHVIKNLKQTKPMVVQVVKNQYGCVDTIFQVINIKPSYIIYFPDAFTPNGDGTNDDFRPKGVGILKFNLNIYDRWGHQVFQTNDITLTWDGKAKNGDVTVKEDVYTWKAQVTDIFNKSHFLVGHVTVIR